MEVTIHEHHCPATNLLEKPAGHPAASMGGDNHLASDYYLAAIRRSGRGGLTRSKTEGQNG